MVLHDHYFWWVTFSQYSGVGIMAEKVCAAESNWPNISCSLWFLYLETVLAKYWNYTSELFVQLVLKNENWLPEQSSLNYVRHPLIQTCAKRLRASKLLRNNKTAVDNLYALINPSNSMHAFTKTLFCEASFINDSMYISIKLSIELSETTDLKFKNNSLTTLPNAISFWNDSFKHHCRPQGPSFLLVTFSPVTLETRTLNVQTLVVWSFSCAHAQCRCPWCP